MAIAFNNHVFKGHRTLLGSKFVTYGEVELPLREDIYEKSKSGFDWGNNSKSANQLAFSMLYQLSTKEIALEYAEQFTKDIVKSLSSRDWVMSASEVLAWIDKNCKSAIQEEKPQEHSIQSSKTSLHLL